MSLVAILAALTLFSAALASVVRRHPLAVAPHNARSELRRRSGS